LKGIPNHGLAVRLESPARPTPIGIEYIARSHDAPLKTRRERAQLARQARGRHPSLKVLYTTGQTIDDQMKALYVDGAAMPQAVHR
jgi:hypothetical protein